ncbi:MAG: biopolymer transporter ExbD [Notoacmeibacter sp.]|nr:biopolymer transporter ExbD [Notoacmeibacter sp.]
MKPLRLPQPVRETFADSTLPLINVVFLLLIFVMLSGVIRAADPVAVDPAISTAEAQSEEFDDDRTLFVTANGAVAFRGMTDETEIAAAMALLYAREGWEAAILKADRDTPANRVVDLTLALRRAGVARLVMVVEKAP